MSKTEFKFKKAPESFGDKDAADIAQGLAGFAWIIAMGSVLANVFIPGDENAWWRFVMAIVVIIIAILLNIVNWTRVGDRLSALYYSYDDMKKLAVANGLKMFGRRKENYDELYYPAIAQLGLRPREEFGCEGVIADIPVTMYAHSYRSQWINYDIGRTWTLVTKLTMPREMPHTFLQTMDKAKGKKATSVARTFDDDQRVSLQNNLDDYFLFYTHRRTVTDALALWSPQLLHSLRELDCQLSVETIGKDVYIYGNNESDQAIDMKRQLKFIEDIAQSFQRSLRVKFLQLPNEEKYPYLRSRASGGVFLFAGKHVKYGWMILAYFAITLSFRLMNDEVGSEEFWIKLGIAVVSLSVFAFFLLYSRSKFTKTKNRRGI